MAVSCSSAPRLADCAPGAGSESTAGAGAGVGVGVGVEAESACEEPDDCPPVASVATSPSGRVASSEAAVRGIAAVGWSSARGADAPPIGSVGCSPSAASEDPASGSCGVVVSGRSSG